MVGKQCQGGIQSKSGKDVACYRYAVRPFFSLILSSYTLQSQQPLSSPSLRQPNPCLEITVHPGALMFSGTQSDTYRPYGHLYEGASCRLPAIEEVPEVSAVGAQSAIFYWIFLLFRFICAPWIFTCCVRSVIPVWSRHPATPTLVIPLLQLNLIQVVLK